MTRDQRSSVDTDSVQRARVHPDVTLHPVRVPARTEFAESLPFFGRPLCVLRVDRVRRGDLIVSAFQPPAAGRMLPSADYFASGAYPADPRPYDPSCACGLCGEDYPGGAVVVTDGWPWDTCDTHPVDALLLVLPYWGQTATLSEVQDAACGRTLRIDTGYESFQHYLATGRYLTVSEPAAL